MGYLSAPPCHLPSMPSHSVLFAWLSHFCPLIYPLLLASLNGQSLGHTKTIIQGYEEVYWLPASSLLQTRLLTWTKFLMILKFQSQCAVIPCPNHYDNSFSTFLFPFFLMPKIFIPISTFRTLTHSRHFTLAVLCSKFY